MNDLSDTKRKRESCNKGLICIESIHLTKSGEEMKSFWKKMLTYQQGPSYDKLVLAAKSEGKSSAEV